jgi:hypothetical protein
MLANRYAVSGSLARQRMQFDQLKRREFMALAGGAIATCAARAQQRGMALIGYVRSESFEDTAQRMIAGFREGLKETGYIEGHCAAVGP